MVKSECNPMKIPCEKNNTLRTSNHFELRTSGALPILILSLVVGFTKRKLYPATLLNDRLQLKISE